MYFDYEELLMAIYGITDDEYEDTDFDQLLCDKLEISFDQFVKTVDLLVPFTPEHTAPLSGKRFRGFVDQEKGIFLLKKEVEKAEVEGETE